MHILYTKKDHRKQTSCSVEFVLKKYLTVYISFEYLECYSLVQKYIYDLIFTY